MPFFSYVEKKSQDISTRFNATDRLMKAAKNVDIERGERSVAQFLTYLKAIDPEKRTRRRTHGANRSQENIVPGDPVVGGGVLRGRNVGRGGRVSRRGRGRGQVFRGGLICAPNSNSVARGDGTTLQVGPAWV